MPPKMRLSGGWIGKRKTLYGWGPPGQGLRRVGPVCSPGCRQMPPLFSPCCPLAAAVTAPACCSPGFTPIALVQKGCLTELAAFLAFTLFFKKSKLVPLRTLHPFVLDPLLKGPRSLYGAHVLTPCPPTSLVLLLPSLSCPLKDPSPLPFLRLQNQSPGIFPWKSETEKLSPFPPLQGKIFSWKGVPWGLGGVPPCPPPGPGDQHLQAGNTQTTVRPGPRGLERAASRAVITGATTTTTGGWST